MQVGWWARASDRLLARLARVTSSGVFLPEIDGLRFIAIALVIAYHVSAAIPHTEVPVRDLAGRPGDVGVFLFDKGFFGVQLFFAISGFILSLPFATHYLLGGRKPALRRYYLRRLTRLEPPYLISLLICFALLTTALHQDARRLLPHLGVSMLYLHGLVYNRMSDINGVLWSLECEVQFYLVVPLLAQVYRIKRTAVRRAAIFAIPLALLPVRAALTKLGAHPEAGGMDAVWAVANDAVRRVLLVHYLPLFCAGFLLTDIYLVSWNSKPRRHPAWDAVGTCAWAALALCVPRHATHAESLWGYHFAYPALILLCYVAAFRGVAWNALVRNRWLATLGGMCYTTYLYHDFIIRLGIDVTVRLSRSIPLQVGLYAAACFSISALLFVLFEKPFMYPDWPARARRILPLAGRKGRRP